MHRSWITIRGGGLDEAGPEVLGDLGFEPDGAGTVLIGELDQPSLRRLQLRLQAPGPQLPI
jgi:hypothetical protein